MDETAPPRLSDRLKQTPAGRKILQNLERQWKALQENPEVRARTEVQIAEVKRAQAEAQNHIESLGFPWPKSYDELERLARAVRIPPETIHSGDYTIGQIRDMGEAWLAEEHARFLRGKAAAKLRRKWDAEQDPSYRPAAEILKLVPKIGTFLKLKAFLEKHPEVSTDKPSKQRLLVHIGQFLDAWNAEERKELEELDAEMVDKLLAEERARQQRAASISRGKSPPA